MAENTPLGMRNRIVYSVFPRNHSAEGTLQAIIPDLPRIRGLGADWLWLLPFHPIGQARRKGPLGSPYAIADYRRVDPALGGEQGLRMLLDAAHAAGLRVMADIVFNHTAPDSVLFTEHPEWFFRHADGKVGNRFGDWYDIIDLDHRQAGLDACLWETLEYWTRFGFDGFRCDVASFLPRAFWRGARARVQAIKPDACFLAESVHPHAVLLMRGLGYDCLSDGEVFESFDVLYEYDVQEAFEWMREGRCAYGAVVERIAMQEYLFPANYAKLRFLENHDTPRAASLFPERARLEAWTALRLLAPGPALVYAGQESGITHRPDLFDRDPVDWNAGDPVFAAWFRRLLGLKQDALLAEGVYRLYPVAGGAVFRYRSDSAELVGICNLEGREGECRLPAEVTADGAYRDLLGDRSLTIHGGVFVLPQGAFVFRP